MAVPSSKSLKCSDQTRKNQLYPNDKHCAAMRNATASPPPPQNECCPRFRPPGFRFTGTTNQNSSSRAEPKREKAAGHSPKCQQLEGPITRRKATESPTQPPRLNNAIASNYPPKTTAAQDSGPHGLLPTKASNQNRPPWAEQNGEKANGHSSKRQHSEGPITRGKVAERNRTRVL